MRFRRSRRRWGMMRVGFRRRCKEKGVWRESGEGGEETEKRMGKWER